MVSMPMICSILHDSQPVRHLCPGCQFMIMSGQRRILRIRSGGCSQGIRRCLRIHHIILGSNMKVNVIPCTPGSAPIPKRKQIHIYTSVRRRRAAPRFCRMAFPVQRLLMIPRFSTCPHHQLRHPARDLPKSLDGLVCPQIRRPFQPRIPVHRQPVQIAVRLYHAPLLLNHMPQLML